MSGKTGTDVFGDLSSNSAGRRYLYFRYLEEDKITEFIQQGKAWESEKMWASGNVFTREDSTVYSEYDITSAEPNGQDAELHIDSYAVLEDGTVRMIGWTLDHQRKSPEAVVVSYKGKWLKGVPIYRLDLEEKYPDQGWCGFQIVADSPNVTFYVVAADGTLCNLVTKDFSS